MVSLTSPKHKTPFCEPLILGPQSSQMQRRTLQSLLLPCLGHHPAFRKLHSPLPCGPSPLPPPRRLGMTLPRNQAGQGPICHFCFRKQLTTSLKKRTGRGKCKLAAHKSSSLHFLRCRHGRGGPGDSWGGERGAVLRLRVRVLT